MRILLIKVKHIGDTLLMTPTAAAIQAAYPAARISALVRSGCESILDGCPAISEVFTTAAPEKANRPADGFLQDLRLIRTLRQRKFDYVLELSETDRGRTLAAFCGAKHRIGCTPGPRVSWLWRRLFEKMLILDPFIGHRAERDYQVAQNAFGLTAEVPGLVFEPSADLPWSGVNPNESYAVIHPSARWEWKRWPVEKWLEVGRFLATRFSKIVISCGPDAQEIAEARAIAEGLGPVAICTEGKLTWAQLAWVLRRARFFVGVDTAAMHLAAACGTPTVALFGASLEHLWSPWKVLHQIVVPYEVPYVPGDDAAYLARAQVRLPSQIPAEKVIHACEDILQRAAALKPGQRF